MSLQLEMNTDFINEAAFLRIQSVAGVSGNVVSGVLWLVAVKTSSGARVAAFPISSVNLSAPPVIAIEAVSGWYRSRAYAERNTATTDAILKKLRNDCQDDDLRDAIHLVQIAVASISKRSTLPAHLQRYGNA